jgi:hypothetical protein
MTPQQPQPQRLYHIDDKFVTACCKCPNCKGGPWYIYFCIGTEMHHPITGEELDIIPLWCPLPVIPHSSAAQQRIDAAIKELEYTVRADVNEDTECHILTAIALLQGERK